MMEIRPLADITADDIHRLITGYTADTVFRACRTESEEEFVLKLELVGRREPYIKRYDHLDDETVTRYLAVAQSPFSFGAYDAGECVALALAELQGWNNSLIIWEFHVSEKYRGNGIGRRLMGAVEEKAREEGPRIIVCETQTTNTPAIRFYQRMGFRIEGVDLSYYRNTDYPDGEIAVFMKKQIQ